MRTPFQDFSKLINLADALAPKRAVRKFFIHFHDGDASDGELKRGDERVYFETSEEARKAIRVNGWGEIAEVESADF